MDVRCRQYKKKKEGTSSIVFDEVRASNECRQNMSKSLIGECCLISAHWLKDNVGVA